MPNGKNVALAYCINNIHVAEDIENQLSQSAFRFQHFYGKGDYGQESLAQQLGATDGPILLIISDNFLKSPQCMFKGLQLLMDRGHDILPIIVDGQVRNESTGEIFSITTHFQKVGDIIQYINYWQDQYLELRRQRKKIKPTEEEKYTRHLMVLREISGEVGEFLRMLRNLRHLELAEFTQNDFQRFFMHIGDMNAWQAYKSLKAKTVALEKGIMEEVEVEPEIRNLAAIDKIGTPPIVVPENSAQELIEPLDAAIESAFEDYFRTIDPQMPEEKYEEPPVFQMQETTPSFVADNSAHGEDTLEPIPLAPEAVEYVSELDASDEDVELEGNDFDLEPPGNLEADNLLPSLIHAPLSSEEMKQLLEQSSALFEANLVDDGLELLKNAVDTYPNDSNVRYRYALALIQHAGNDKEAVQQLEILMDEDPSFEEAYILLAEVAESDQDFLLAKSCYEKVAEINSNYPEIFYRLALVTSLGFEDKKELAEEYFRKALRKNPLNVDAHHKYAILLNESLDKPKKAVNHFKTTLDLQPDHPTAAFDLAMLYHQIGEIKKAKEAYRLAVEINPNIQDPEHDMAFDYGKSEKQDAHAPIGSLEHDTIEALKQNLTRLEELLRTKKEKKISDVVTPSKIVFITGASSGIGRATAEIFARNNYRLILNGRRIDRLEELKQELETEYNAQVKLLPFDVRDVYSVKEAIDFLEDEWKNIDVLVNNAGKAKGFDPIQSGKLEHWEEMIDTNVKGLLYLTKAIAPIMTARQTGHIINIGSIAGKEVYPNGNVYCASKAAVDMLTKAMRVDLYKHGIRVSQIAPGMVEETEFALVRFDGDVEKAKIYEDFQPLTAADVAETIYYVASRPAHVNIQDIVLLSAQQAGSTYVDRSGRKDNGDH